MDVLCCMAIWIVVKIVRLPLSNEELLTHYNLLITISTYLLSEFAMKILLVFNK